MGNTQIGYSYKTKALLEIFLWYIKQRGFDKYKCDDIFSLITDDENAHLNKEEYESQYLIPFELVETEGIVTITNLQITMLLFSEDEQGERIELFKILTNDPEKLIHYFRWKYELIYNRIPQYLSYNKLIIPTCVEKFVSKKHSKILDKANEKYTEYTTSSCNILKLTMLKV